MNAGAAGQGAVQGAQAGAQFGPYGAAIGGAIGFLGGLFSKDTELEALKNFNKEVTKFTAKSLFDLERGQQVENIRTAQALASYQDANKVGASTYNAQYGAADILGGSSTALTQVLDYQSKQAQARTWLTHQIGVDNYVAGVEGIVNQGTQQLKRTKGQQGNSNIGGLVQQGFSAYSKYSTAKGAGTSGGFNAGLQLGSTPTSNSNISSFKFTGSLTG